MNKETELNITTRINYNISKTLLKETELNITTRINYNISKTLLKCQQRQ